MGLRWYVDYIGFHDLPPPTTTLSPASSTIINTDSTRFINNDERDLLFQPHNTEIDTESNAFVFA